MGIQINGQTDTVTAIDGSINVGGDVTIPGVLTYEDVTNVDSVGIVTAQAGIRVTGGSIGIGTDNPTKDLTITGNNPGILLKEDSANSELLLTVSDSDGTGVIAATRPSNYTYEQLAIRGQDLIFETTSTQSRVERLRITSDGKVAIGFNAPAVAGRSISNSSTNRGFEFDTGSGFDSTSCIRAYDRPTTAYKSLGLTGSDIKFAINDVEKVRITSGGLVGVNCTPLSQFQVKGGTNANIGLTVMSSEAAIEAFNDAGSANVPLRLRASEHRFFVSSTEKVHISSGGLAINKSSAADTEIEIVQSADPTLRLYDTRNVAYKADFMMAGSGPLIRNNNTTATDRTLTVQKGTTDHLVIEGNGYVRTPNQPSFFSRPPASYNLSVGGNTIGGTWSDVHDIGSHFSNGTFTAPVAGTYQFSWSVFVQSETTRIDAYIMVNGTGVMREEITGYQSTAYNKNASVHGCYYLSANDAVTFGLHSTAGTNIYVAAQPWSYASGFLVG